MMLLLCLISEKSYEIYKMFASLEVFMVRRRYELQAVLIRWAISLLYD